MHEIAHKCAIFSFFWGYIEGAFNALIKTLSIFRERSRRMAGLTKKQKSFCIGFINFGNIAEAEAYSGVKNGRELLCREEIRDELRRLSDVFNESVACIAGAGLIKLAEGCFMTSTRAPRLSTIWICLWSRKYGAKTTRSRSSFLTASRRCASFPREMRKGQARDRFTTRLWREPKA